MNIWNTSLEPCNLGMKKELSIGRGKIEIPILHERPWMRTGEHDPHMPHMELGREGPKRPFKLRLKEDSMRLNGGRM